MSILATVKKALFGYEDLRIGVGTFTRPSSTGTNLTVTKIGLHTLSGTYSTVGVVEFDGSTDIHAGLTSLISTVSGLGGGIIQLPAGVGVTSAAISLPSGVVLQGQGPRATTIKLAASAGTAVVESDDFASLTGQAKAHSNDVPQGFGLRDLRIDGNRDNQSATPSGVRFYGKWYVLDNVQIVNAAGIGLESEMGGGGGTGFTSTLDDADQTSISPQIIRNESNNQVESRIDLYVRRSGGVGVQWKGPHDAIFESLIVAGSGSHGVTLESLTGSYEASCDIKFAHIYANNGVGFWAKAVFRADHLISESNYEQGVLLDEYCPRAQIGLMQLYRNNWYGGWGGQTNLVRPSLHIRTTTVSIGECVIEDDFAGNGLVIERASGASTGNNLNQISNLMINGKSTAATGIVIRGNSNFIRGSVFGYTGSGGQGLWIDHSGGTRANNRFDLYLAAETLFRNDGGNGLANRYDLSGGYDSGATPAQSAFSGNYPAVADNEQWNIYFYDTATGGTAAVDRVWRADANYPTNFTASDATPSVKGKTVFRTNNTVATTITALDDGIAGQVVYVIFADDVTTIDFTSTNLKGNGGVDFTGTTTDIMTCVYGGTNWVCTVSDNTSGRLRLTDGITAPTAIVGQALIYVDTADGDLKVKFGDGTIKTIVVDT